MLIYDYAIQKGENMATNILLVNQKGGVGKTTFADELAWGLARRGHKVGFGNLAPQGGANHEKNLLDDEGAAFRNGNTVTMDGFVAAGLRMIQCDYPALMDEYLRDKGKR